MDQVLVSVILSFSFSLKEVTGSVREEVVASTWKNNWKTWVKPGKEEKIGKKNLEKINRKLNKAVETNVEVYQMTTELAKKKKGEAEIIKNTKEQLFEGRV